MKNVPLAALAAILFMVAYNMGDWEEIPEILKLSKADIAVWADHAHLTVVADLTFAVEVGMILAALTFIRKISRTTTVSRVTEDYVEDSRAHILQGKDIPDYAVVYRIHGPFLFGAPINFRKSLDDLPDTSPDRDSASAQYDRHRRHGPWRDSRTRRAVSRFRTDAICSAELAVNRRN